jgi:hypothetical protein
MKIIGDEKSRDTVPLKQEETRKGRKQILIGLKVFKIRNWQLYAG